MGTNNDWSLIIIFASSRHFVYVFSLVYSFAYFEIPFVTKKNYNFNWEAYQIGITNSLIKNDQ